MSTIKFRKGLKSVFSKSCIQFRCPCKNGNNDNNNNNNLYDSGVVGWDLNLIAPKAFGRFSICHSVEHNACYIKLLSL